MFLFGWRFIDKAVNEIIYFSDNVTWIKVKKYIIISNMWMMCVLPPCAYFKHLNCVYNENVLIYNATDG